MSESEILKTQLAEMEVFDKRVSQMFSKDKGWSSTTPNKSKVFKHTEVRRVILFHSDSGLEFEIIVRKQFDPNLFSFGVKIFIPSFGEQMAWHENTVDLFFKYNVKDIGKTAAQAFKEHIKRCQGNIDMLIASRNSEIRRVQKMLDWYGKFKKAWNELGANT